MSSWDSTVYESDGLNDEILTIVKLFIMMASTFAIHPVCIVCKITRTA